MKFLYSTGGSTPQTVISNNSRRAQRGTHDPWGSHTVDIDVTSGVTFGSSGRAYGYIGGILKDGLHYTWLTEISFDTYTEYYDWQNAWNSVRIFSDERVWFGLGWNFTGRSYFTAKVLTSELDLWVATH